MNYCRVKKSTIGLIVMPLILLTACSSSDDSENMTNAGTDDAVTKPLSRAAFFLLEDQSPGPVGSPPYMSASTFKFNDAKTIEQIMSQTTASYTQTVEECGTLSSFDFNGTDPYGFGELNYISAGEVITAQSDGSSYAEMMMSRTGDYEWQGSSNDLFPDAMLFNIPGAEFPAIDNITIPAMNEIALVEQAEYQAGDTLKWMPGKNDNLPVWIRFDNSLICITADDGEFQIPAMQETASVITIQRRQIQITEQNDTMVVVFRVREWEN